MAGGVFEADRPKGFPEIARERRPCPCAASNSDTVVVRELKTMAAHRAHEARCRDALAPRRAARGEQTRRKVERRRQRRRFQAEAPVHAPVERQSHERVVGIRVQRAHETQRLAVSADEDVQAVVERDVVHDDASRAASKMGSGFVNGDRNAGVRERHRGGHAGVAAADDGDAHG